MDNAGGPSRSDQLDLMLTYEQQAHAHTKAERDAALAERDALLVQVDQWRQTADREVTACVEMRAERDEARRVLREASDWLEPEISRGPAIPAWVRMMRDLAAVLAQEENVRLKAQLKIAEGQR